MRSPKIVSGVVRGVADLGKNVVYEAGKQAAKVVEEGAEELIGAQSSQPSSGANTSSVFGEQSNVSPGEKTKERGELEKLRKGLHQSAGPKRDVEKEIEEVREEKKKEEEEKEFLEQLEKQRKEEEEEAKRDAQALEEAALPGAGERPKRGVLFAIRQKQRKAELGRGSKD